MVPPQKIDGKKLSKQLLPTEHGSWAFVLEPAIIGWIATPGRAISALLVAGVLGFLAYRPAKLAATDLLKKKRYPRTIPATAVATILGLAILGCILLALPPSLSLWPYLALVAAVGAAFLVLEQVAAPRSLMRELAGACLMLPLLGAALCTHASNSLTGVLLGYLLLRVLATVLSVRSVFHRTPDWKICRVVAILAGLAIMPMELMLRNHPSLVGVPPYAPVALRSVWLAATATIPREAKHVGIVESIVSLLVVGLWAWHVGL